jgi:hypothetical protein
VFVMLRYPMTVTQLLLVLVPAVIIGAVVVYLAGHWPTRDQSPAAAPCGDRRPSDTVR